MRKLIRGATLIDGTGSPALPDSAVFIEDQRIAAVGRSGDFTNKPDGTQVLDASGMFLLPGFVNAHEHVTNKRVRGTRAAKLQASTDFMAAMGVGNALLDLKEGFTTIRDMGSKAASARGVKIALDRGLVAGPTMVLVSQGITVTAGYSSLVSVEVDSPVEARKAAGRIIKEGTDWIKCMASIEWERGEGEPLSAVNMEVDLMRAAFDIAHHHGKPCAVHAINDQAIVNAIEAGVDTVEHGIMLSRETAELMARKCIYLVPTLSGYREHCNDWGRGEGVMRHGRLLREPHAQGFRNAVEAGVKYAYGSDTLGNLVDEATIMQENGASAMNCILAATRNGAELLGMTSRIGTVAKEMMADLVVLGSNPLATPTAFGDVRLVIKSGRVFDPNQIPV